MSKEDLDAIAATVDDYFYGMYRSDGSLIEKAFTEDALIIGHTEGSYAQMTRADFAGFVAKQASADEAGEPFDMRIVSVDVTVDAAVVKVADRYLGRDFIDYLTLIKKDGRWVIAHKAWHTGPRG
jgi:hypothetical protein